MLRRIIRISLAAGLLTVGLATAVTAQEAANYFVPPGSDAGIAASMYPSPRWTPPVVGHTNITYPPLAPHEFLYKHSATYRDSSPCGGVTTTRVHYGHFAAPVRLHRFFWGPKQ